MSEKLNSVAAKVASKYAGLSGNAEAALDPATIGMYAQLILQVIEMFKACKSTPKAAADTAKSPGLFARMRLRSVVKDNMSRDEWRSHGPHVVQALLDSGLETTPDEIASLYSDSE
jgi:hypothetical protein